MLRRDNFRKRWDDGDAVFLHEFLYALMQGYDAYALKCDAQVGGTEQLFNLMAGRKIQEDAGQRPHVPVTLPILVGLDGKERMSKSKGNHIGVDDPPDEQYGKAMSIPDGAIVDFFVLATSVPRSELEQIQAEVEREPMAAKKRLARTIVSEFWGEPAALAAEERWTRQFQQKEAPAEIPGFRLSGGEALVDVLVAAGLAPSKREARRLFEQRAVTVDGQTAVESAVAQAGSVVQVGKRRWLRLE
jgi:tyrosyl-tRNA synthetase